MWMEILGYTDACPLCGQLERGCHLEKMWDHCDEESRSDIELLAAYEGTDGHITLFRVKGEEQLRETREIFNHHEDMRLLYYRLVDRETVLKDLAVERSVLSQGLKHLSDVEQVVAEPLNTGDLLGSP
jgi:hypothetical protein